MVDGEKDDGPPPGWQQPIPPRSRSLPSSPSPSVAEMAQMVCGSCSRLLSYPRGARHVKCSCCQMVNYVLEVLLMYPYGASSVQCSSCLLVTEIGDHNRRPPWSVQQGQPPTPNPVH